MQSRSGSKTRVEVQRVGAIGAMVLCAVLSLAQFENFISHAQAAGQVESASVEKLIADLKNSDEKVRVAATDALAAKGAAAKEATQALAALLSDPSENVRAHAAHALMQIGPDAVAVAPALARAISDPDYHVRRMAIAALERIHPEPEVVISALAKALEDVDSSVRVAALSSLTDYKSAAVPVLSKALEKPGIRYWAALALGELGPEARDAVPALAAALNDERPEVRREVLIALARVGAEAHAAVPAIAKQLADEDESVAHAAAFALGSIGPEAASATESLQSVFGKENKLSECINCWALARIHPQDAAVRERAIGLLLETVKNDNPRVQSAAVRGLMDLKAPPQQLVPALGYVVLNGEEPAVGEALGALALLGDAAIEVLDDALERSEARGRAALLITYLGAKAKGTVPALITALSDPDAEVRQELLFALASMGPDAAPAIDAIVVSLDDENTANRAVAALALGKIGPDAKSAVPKLQKELASADSLVRVASAFALVHIVGDNQQIVISTIPVLVEGLKHPVPAARRGSAESLGQIGKPARQAAERALQDVAANDQEEIVRDAAKRALEKLGVATH